MLLRIDIVGVYKLYKRNVKALNGIDLLINRGDTIGLIGPNGAGKTTLINILLRLIKPTGGDVHYTLEDVSLDHLFSRIGFLLENRGLYEDLTVEENLVFWARLHQVGFDRVNSILHKWSLWDKRKELAGRLSAGMRQKLALARSLLNDPLFLVLDEPTSQLDLETRRSVVDLLNSYSCTEGKTLLIASHDLVDIEKICSRVILMQEGKIAVDSPIERLADKLGMVSEVIIRYGGIIDSKLWEEMMKKYKIKRSGQQSLTTLAGYTDINELISFLVEHGIDIYRVEENKITLEDFYSKFIKEYNAK